MASKTNAVRLVEQAGFTCKEAFYDYDENDLNGNHAAKAIGLPPEPGFMYLNFVTNLGIIYRFCRS